MRQWKIIGSMILVICCGAANVYGSGYAVFTHGASALGQGNAVTAHADDPTTIFYNPALMNKLEGTQVEIGTTLMFPSREYVGASSTAETKNTINYPSTFYVTHKFNDKISAGLGVFSPFGLGHEWGETWQGKYITTKSEMQTFNINPVASIQLTPYLAVAAGVDILLLDATLEKKIPSSALSIPGPAFDIGSKFKGDGTGIGYNFGLLLDLCKDFTFGATYRSQIKVTAKGDLSVSGAPSLVAAMLNTTGKSSLTLPQQITAGLAYKGIDNLALEAGMRWEGWSSFKQLAIEFDNGNPPSVTQRNWNDVFGFNLGGKYKVNDTVSLMAGYLYGNSPIPDNTFDPTIPDSTTHVFSIGSDLDYKKFKISAAYAYQLFDGRNRPATSLIAGGAAGHYESDVHMVALGFVYRF